MEQIILPVMLSILMQNCIWSQGGFTIPGTVTSGPSSPTACCDAWFETKAPGRHTVVDVSFVGSNYYILSNVENHGVIARYTNAGELVWRYKMEEASQFTEMVQLGFGDLVIGGHVGSLDRQGLLLFISSDGAVLGQEIISSNDYNNLSVQDLALSYQSAGSLPYSYVVSSYLFTGIGGGTPERLYESKFLGSERGSMVNDGREYAVNNPFRAPDEQGAGYCTVKVSEIIPWSSSVSTERYLLAGSMCETTAYGVVVATDIAGNVSRSWVTVGGDDMQHLDHAGNGLVVAAGHSGFTGNGDSRNFNRKPAIHLLDPEAPNKYRSYTFDPSQIYRDFYSIGVSLHGNVYASTYDAAGRPVIVEAKINKETNTLEFSPNGLIIGPPGEIAEGIVFEFNKYGDELIFAYSFETHREGAEYDIRFGKIQLPFSPTTCLPAFPLTVIDEGQKNLVAVEQFSYPLTLGWSVNVDLPQALIPEDLFVNGPCQLDDLTPCATPSALATSGYFKLPREVASCTDKVAKVQIDDALGRTVTNWTMELLPENVVIDITMLPPGRYYVTLAASDDSVIYTTRVSTL